MFYMRFNTFNVIGKPFLRWRRQLVHRQTWLVSSLGIATVNTLNVLMFLFIVALPLHIMAKSSLTVLTHIVVFGVPIVSTVSGIVCPGLQSHSQDGYTSTLFQCEFSHAQ